MPFRHPCFISYVRGEHGVVKGFIDQLSTMLWDSLEPYFDEKPYIDRELIPGEHFEEKVAEAICKSVCMIVVYFPKYADHEFCMREYYAMEILERQRLPLLGDHADGRGLIIPIVLRGRKEDLPLNIRDRIHFCDFSNFTTASIDITRDPKYVDKIERIAASIFDLRKAFENLENDVCDGCGTFRLPEKIDVKPWRSNPSGSASPFVLRDRVDKA